MRQRSEKRKLLNGAAAPLRSLAGKKNHDVSRGRGVQALPRLEKMKANGPNRDLEVGGDLLARLATDQTLNDFFLPWT